MNVSILHILAESGADERSLQALERQVKGRGHAAGDYLLRQGTAAPQLLFLAEGLVKMVYTTPTGGEYIKSFLDAGSFVGSLAALLEGLPSTFSVVCLEATRVEVLPYAALEVLTERDPAVLRFALVLFQRLALKKERREHDLLCLTAEQRYRQFLRDQPRVAERVTQADIARYLGITPVALSRIRGRIKGE